MRGVRRHCTLMTERTARVIARTSTVFGSAISAFWVWVLWEYWNGGPSPGAGAQYVFILLPTVLLAILMLAASTAWHAYALLQRAHERTPTNRMFLLVSAVGFSILALYWLRVLRII